MKQNTLKCLSCSLLLLITISCKKKESGILQDLNTGKFDFICTWQKNEVFDTVKGEVSGPYIQGYYIFRVRRELNSRNSFFKLISPSNRSSLTTFDVQELNLYAPITHSEHDSDHLAVDFQSNTMSGSFKLTRKE